MIPDWAGWLRFRSEFETILDPRLYTVDFVEGCILSGAWRLWVGEDAAILTELKHYPTGAMRVSGVAAAGDLNEIVKSLIPAAEEWGRSIGCIGALIESREGWARVLGKHGYEVHQVVLVKDFERANHGH